MNSYIEIFDYFVDDLLSSDIDLLKYELDLLLMQYLFKSTDLEVLEKIDADENILLAS